jgi:hypothetical protein
MCRKIDMGFSPCGMLFAPGQSRKRLSPQRSRAIRALAIWHEFRNIPGDIGVSRDRSRIRELTPHPFTVRLRKDGAPGGQDKGCSWDLMD